MTTYISTSTDEVEMIQLDESQEAYLDQIIALDGRDRIVLEEQPVRNGSGRIIGSHLTITTGTWETIQEAVTAAAEDEDARTEQGREEAAQEVALAALQEATGELDYRRRELEQATTAAGQARTAVDDATIARDEAIRAALDAGVTGYRLARIIGMSTSQISRIGARR